MARRVKSISMNPVCDAKLTARVAAARAEGRTSNYSEEIRRCVEEADGNVQRIRHAIREELNAIGLNVTLLRRGFHAGRDSSCLNAIALSVVNITAAVGTASI